MFRRIKKYIRFLKSLFLTNLRLLRGMWKLTRLPQPAITIFGGSRIEKDSVHAKRAYELSKKLTLGGYSIITGGGQGIMQAGNLGAYDAAKIMGVKKNGKAKKMTSLGITLTAFQAEQSNPYVHDTIVMNHFFSRKWLLVRYSIGFIVFPGGFGTLDELFEIVTLEQTYRMPRMPIILMDKRYWEPIMHWAKSRALKHGLIKKEDLDLIKITSDVDEVLELICTHCKDKPKQKRPLYTR